MEGWLSACGLLPEEVTLLGWLPLRKEWEVDPVDSLGAASTSSHLLEHQTAIPTTASAASAASASAASASAASAATAAGRFSVRWRWVRHV